MKTQKLYNELTKKPLLKNCNGRQPQQWQQRIRTRHTTKLSQVYSNNLWRNMKLFTKNVLSWEGPKQIRREDYFSFQSSLRTVTKPEEGDSNKSEDSGRGLAEFDPAYLQGHYRRRLQLPISGVKKPTHLAVSETGSAACFCACAVCETCSKWSLLSTGSSSFIIMRKLDSASAIIYSL